MITYQRILDAFHVEREVTEENDYTAHLNDLGIDPEALAIFVMEYIKENIQMIARIIIADLSKSKGNTEILGLEPTLCALFSRGFSIGVATAKAEYLEEATALSNHSLKGDA